MGGEDFALMAAMVPSFRLLVGSSQPGRQDKVHSPIYQPDERSIAFGTMALARTVVDVLS
jgi:metal-dependent amidase/aminoacylase/carboxypeptidase family protein